MRVPGVVASVLVAVCGFGWAAAEDDYYVKLKGDQKKLGTPTTEAALVYVVRPANLGAAVRTWAFHEETLIGVMRGNGYTFALVPPGKRLFWSKAENTSAVELEVEAGKTYYFKQKIAMGVGKARVKMLPIDETEARKAMEECGYCEVTDEGRKRGAEIAAERLGRAEEKAAKKAAEAREQVDPE